MEGNNSYFDSWSVNRGEVGIINVKPTESLPPYITLALVKDLVVLAEGRQKYDGSDILKTVDPLPPL